MYKKFFGLKENPFNVNPDPRYLFLTHHTQEALACLTYGIETRKGFILLTGEVGTGKTTLIDKLLEWLHKENVSTQNCARSWPPAISKLRNKVRPPVTPIIKSSANVGGIISVIPATARTGSFYLNACCTRGQYTGLSCGL